MKYPTSDQSLLYQEKLSACLDEGVKKDKVIILAGPTGSGKTQLSLHLAELLGAEIISADSMQVYQKMDVGTAKVSMHHRQNIPHHLIDICRLSQPFNVVDFYHAARQAIQKILLKNKVPIIVGGSGFYIRTLIYGPPMGPSSCTQTRNDIEEKMEKLGPELLFQELKSQDPVYAQSITVHDRQKIIRALEILKLTGRKVSDLEWKQSNENLDYDFKSWFIYRPRESLYPIIDKRCEEMIDRGLIEEVKSLKNEGLEDNLSASQSIGYKHALEYLSSPKSQEDYAHFIRLFKQASRRYAKRQFTWFRNESLFRWLNLELYDPETLIDIICRDYHQS